MRVLVGCEYSGVVRDAFTARGHSAASCDILPTESPGEHYQCDVLQVINQEHWDLAIFHPPCTHLAVSGARYFKDKQVQQVEALEFVRQLLAAPVEMIALENPISIISSKIRKPDQIIQPWMFGHDAQKATCLWLKGLPKLVSTQYVPPSKLCSNGKWRYANQSPCGANNLGPSPTRAHERSRTYSGIAAAMACQWGCMMPESEM